MIYANYENEEIKYLGKLPKSYLNVSGFDNSSIEELNKVNWYEYIDNYPTLKEWENVISSSISLVDNKVVKEYQLKDRTLDEYKDIKYDTIKDNTRYAVLKIYPEYKQVSASMGLYSEETNLEIINYIKKTIDGVSILKEQVFNSISYEEIELIPNIFEVV